MAANGISELATKELRQIAKLDLATLKRQGNVLNSDGTVYSTPLGSAQFNGSNQYLTVPADPALALGTGDFTVETWVYLSSAPGDYAVIDCAGTGQFGFLINSTDIVAYASVAESYSFTSAVSASAWHHIAFCRIGTTLTCYLDGVSVGTPATSSYDFTSPGTFTIGRNPGANSQYLNGYLSNLRIVKGQALYTANFTPPTGTLTAVAGTQLLLLNGATEFVDGSSNQFTITNSGSVTLSTTAPTLTISAPFYRTLNILDISELPTKYSGNTVVDNINQGGLVQGRPWSTTETPDLFTGLQIWYDTALASTINGGTYSNGTIVTTFTNRATGVNPPSVSADGPVVLTGAGDTLNGYPILRFVSSTGTSDGFRLTTDSFDDVTGWTMVMLAKPSVTPGKNPSLFRIMDLGTFTDRAVVRYVSQSQFILYAPTGSATVASNVDPDGTWKIITCRYDSTAAAASRFTFRWGKSAKTVTNGGTAPSGTIPATARYVDLMNAWDSDFAEQVVYNRALSDAEIIALEDYLSSKWGV
jgi:hypothetical protein